MKNTQFPSTEQTSLSGDVPFPEVEFSFLHGLRVTLRPKDMSHSVMGVHYILEVEGPEGSRAAMGITFGAHGQGRDFKRHIEITAERGLPLIAVGPRYSFNFSGSHPAFYPPLGSYAIKMNPNEGYGIELYQPPSKFTLYHEPPPKVSGDLD